VRTNITDTSAEVSNGVLSASIDLKHPAIDTLRVAPTAAGEYTDNLFHTSARGIRGIITLVGPGGMDAESSYNSNSHPTASAYTSGAASGVEVGNISDSGPKGANPVARETWFLTLLPGDSSGVIWDRTVQFIHDTDLSYTSLDGGDTGAPQWVDSVMLIRPDTEPVSGSFNPLLAQIQGDVPPSLYTSLVGRVPGAPGQPTMDAGQVIANSLRGIHHAGEEVHLRYRIEVVDTRAWFGGLPATDRQALLQAAWYSQVTKWWRGNATLPGMVSLDGTARDVRWLSLEWSLPMAASFWAPHRFLGGDTLWWANYDQWVVAGQAVDGESLGVGPDEEGFMALRLTDLGVPLPTSGFLQTPQPGTASLPVDVERLYSFTKNRTQLARLMPRLRLAQRWIEAHPTPLFYGGAPLQALARLYRVVGDTEGAAKMDGELTKWKQDLAASWNRAWLEKQDYRELAAMADYGLLTAQQQSDLLALINDYKDSEIPPASRQLTHPRGPGDYATGLFATVFRAKEKDPDRAYEMASAVVSRINQNPHEPFAGFDAAGQPTGPSGYSASAAIDGMYAWGIFGFEPSTEDDTFTLQPAIPAVWEGKPYSYSFEYALSAERPNTTLDVTYTRNGDNLDTVLDLKGIGSGGGALKVNVGGTTVNGAPRTDEALFHLTLKNEGRYVFTFVPAAPAKPSPVFQTARATAADPGAGLADGQLIGAIDGSFTGAEPVTEVGINWKATSPPGSVVRMFLSNDGGADWDAVLNGEWHVFTTKATKGLQYHLALARGASEDVRVHSVTATFASGTVPGPASLPAVAAAAPTGGDTAFLETFDTGLDHAGPHDGALHVGQDTSGDLIGPGSLLVSAEPGTGYGSVWLAHDISYDPAKYPYLDFWVQTHSASFLAIWVELGDPGLVKDGLAYQLPGGQRVTPLLVITARGLVPSSLALLGDLLIPPDGVKQHISFNVNDAITRLFGPGPHTITGLRLVNYIDPSGGIYHFDQVSARETAAP